MSTKGPAGWSGLPAGQRIAYRDLFQDLRDPRAWSLPVEGSFRTPPAGRGDVRVAFTADTCGQGWGIDAARGGSLTYESMLRARPDLFVHLGDTVYADNPLLPEVVLEDGSAWRNLVTPAKAKVAETLDEFRGNHLYNRLDPHLGRVESEVSQVVLWDDHEVMNNWYPGKVIQDPRYTERSASLLAARARRAFLEHYPIRRSPADPELHLPLPAVRPLARGVPHADRARRRECPRRCQHPAPPAPRPSPPAATPASPW